MGLSDRCAGPGDIARQISRSLGGKLNYFSENKAAAAANANSRAHCNCTNQRARNTSRHRRKRPHRPSGLLIYEQNKAEELRDDSNEQNKELADAERGCLAAGLRSQRTSASCSQVPMGQGQNRLSDKSLHSSSTAMRTRPTTWTRTTKTTTNTLTKLARHPRGSLARNLEHQPIKLIVILFLISQIILLVFETTAPEYHCEQANNFQLAASAGLDHLRAYDCLLPLETQQQTHQACAPEPNPDCGPTSCQQEGSTTTADKLIMTTSRSCLCHPGRRPRPAQCAPLETTSPSSHSHQPLSLAAPSPGEGGWRGDCSSASAVNLSRPPQWAHRAAKWLVVGALANLFPVAEGALIKQPRRPPRPGRAVRDDSSLALMRSLLLIGTSGLSESEHTDYNISGRFNAATAAMILTRRRHRRRSQVMQPPVLASSLSNYGRLFAMQTESASRDSHNRSDDRLAGGRMSNELGQRDIGWLNSQLTNSERLTAINDQAGNENQMDPQSPGRIIDTAGPPSSSDDMESIDSTSASSSSNDSGGNDGDSSDESPPNSSSSNPDCTTDPSAEQLLANGTGGNGTCIEISAIAETLPSVGVRIAFFVLYGTIFGVGLIGNTLTLYAMRRKKEKSSTMDIFIANLALSDIMLCVFAVPITPIYMLYYGYWVFGLPLCKLLTFAQGSSVYISTLTMIIIAYVRYQLIVYPHHESMSLKAAAILSMCTWLFGLLITLPYLMHVGLRPEQCALKFCDENWEKEIHRFWFSVITLILQFFIPFIGVSFFYGSIFWKLRNQKQKRHTGGAGNNRKAAQYSIQQKNNTKRQTTEQPQNDENETSIIALDNEHGNSELTAITNGLPAGKCVADGHVGGPAWLLNRFKHGFHHHHHKGGVGGSDKVVVVERELHSVIGIERPDTPIGNINNNNKSPRCSQQQVVVATNELHSATTTTSLKQSCLQEDEIGEQVRGRFSPPITQSINSSSNINNNRNRQQRNSTSAVETGATARKASTSTGSMRQSHQQANSRLMNTAHAQVAAEGGAGHHQHHPTDILAMREQRQREKDKRLTRTNRKLVCMVVLFVFSWLPLNMFNLIQDYFETISDSPYVKHVFIFVHLIACSSVCYNPILYAWMSENYRQELQGVLPQVLLNKLCKSVPSAASANTINLSYAVPAAGQETGSLGANSTTGRSAPPPRHHR